MNNYLEVLSVVFVAVASVIMIIAAIYVLRQKDLLIATVSSSIISLILSVFFFMLQAPDVALTEAAVGVGLETIIFVVLIRNTIRYEEK